jgi:hypothetical protein
MSEIQTISVVVAATSVVAFVINSIITSRKTEKTQELTLKSQQQNLETRQAQLFMQIYSKIYDPEFLNNGREAMNIDYKNLDDFNAKLSHETNRDLYGKFWSFPWFLEGMGVLVKRGLIDPKLVDDLISGLVVSYWEKFKPMTLEYRERYNYPQMGEHVEYLYNVVKGIAVGEHPELRDREIRSTA